ncbi:hypothetical protein FRB96_007601 [Tulasnella sp. 330]|nr:hypothetical protein FRB96_007601 [Tulasnella sp. 330]KAG8884179.1 hypothetical protein FRB97_004958 [Tulasnella sp. 331]KAG8889138.1 hypothetical protein FRB98_005613 [Tulasnella sp. 332]
MALFNRRRPAAENNENNDANDGGDGKKKGSKRPANTAFKQQRLKAWQPILTPKTVLPTLFIIGLIFAPIGGLLIWGSSLVTQITIDYTNCDQQGSTFTQVPKYNYELRSSDSGKPYSPPQYSFTNTTTGGTVGQTEACTIRFDIPADLQPPVFVYYKLSNFHQNHRRYVQSQDADQLKGKAVSASTLDNGNCKPLGSIDGKPIYPCGLIANSLFNDTIGNPVQVNSDGTTGNTYTFSQTNIAWPGEAKKYAEAPGYDSLSDIVPPPNWGALYPNGYTTDNPPPNLRTNEHFQNWMRTAGLPTFSKLYGRNDNDVFTNGTYQMTVYMNFPVAGFGGTKSIVISTVSWIGGKNAFLGWAYVGAAALFILLAVAGTVRHIIKPRKLGDMSLLSWNQPGNNVQGAR